MTPRTSEIVMKNENYFRKKCNILITRHVYEIAVGIKIARKTEYDLENASNKINLQRKGKKL